MKLHLDDWCAVHVQRNATLGVWLYVRDPVDSAGFHLTPEQARRVAEELLKMAGEEETT
jgi:hypothetical protein